ncbi:MAG: acyl-CoA thioesterase [Silicimonas sp.]|nr:acyl-CoA thioesterase [Silicimonas sp.]
MPDFINTLDRDGLEAHGITGWSYGFFDQVRFSEIDALAHVNNVVYLQWFETARVRYIQAFGMTAYGPEDPQIVVRHQTADYLAPMYMEEIYVIAARTRLLKATSLIMEYGVFREGEMVAKGDAVCISLEQDGKTRRAHYPAAVEKILEIDAPEQA